MPVKAVKVFAEQQNQKVHRRQNTNPTAQGQGVEYRDVYISAQVHAVHTKGAECQGQGSRNQARVFAAFNGGSVLGSALRV